MMMAIILLALGVALLAQSPEAYPGQHTHAMPPDGWMCMPANSTTFVPASHQCSCKRMIQENDQGCMKNDDGTMHVLEDPACAVFCHMDHCSCPVMHCTEGS